MILAFALAAILILFLGILTEYLKGTYVTPPMVCVVVGFLVGAGGFEVLPESFTLDNQGIQAVFRITLVLVLFADSSKIHIKSVWKQHTIPLRMLMIGVPLYIIFGMGAGKLLFNNIGLWEIALLASILACTDAALGQSMLSSPEIPENEKQILLLESNLNDGFVLPIILFLGICDSVWAGVQYTEYWVWFVTIQFGGGIIFGFLVGYLGGHLLRWISKLKKVNCAFEQLATFSIALLSYAVAESVHGNGFIAAVIAGLTIQNYGKGVSLHHRDYAEAHSQLFSLLTFLIFGALVMNDALVNLTWNTVIYSILSLSLVRLAAIVLSLWGTKIPEKSKWLLGWFGPRGVASLLFVLLVVDSFPIAHNKEIYLVVSFTVLMSVFLHGLTAIPIANWYGRVK